MAEPLVSVVMPVRDGAAYLREAIESVLGQIHPAVQLIVVDDGSADDSAGIARSFAPRLVLEMGPARGAAAARNLGIGRAEGEFLTFIDADDRWPADRLSVLLEGFRRTPPPDLVFGRQLEFPGDFEPETALVGSTLLVRRETFERVGRLSCDWRVGEFMDWLLRARDAGLRELMLDDVVLHRRRHAESLTATGRGEYGDYTQILHAALARRRSRERHTG